MLLANSHFAQGDSTKLYINNLYSNWKSTYNKYDFEHGGGNQKDISSLFSKQFADSNRVQNFLVELKQLESDYYKGNIGLGFNAGFLNNPTGGEQDFDNIIYRSRFITDVGWDILRSGYLHNRLKSQIAENESRIASIEDKELKKNANFAILWNYIIYQFNLQKIQVLNDRMKLAQDKIDAIKKLYFLNKVDESELLKHLESIAEIRSMFNIYKEFNEQLKIEYQFNANDTLDLPLIDIKYNKIKERLDGQQQDSIAYLMQENIDLKNKFIKDISLRTSVRYSYYDLVTDNPASRDFFSLGISLGIPINFNRKTKAEWINLQKESVEYIPENDRITIQKSILNNYYEFRYKLKQYTSMHYKRLLYQELLRKENARYSIDYLSFNPVSSLRILDDLMKIDIEMLDLKQQMYLKLISIHTEIPYNEINELYSIHTLDDEFENVYSSKRSIYIWDNLFDNYDLPFLLSYMEKEDFVGAIVSYNLKQNNTKIKNNFIDTLSSKGVKIEIMTGKNALLGSNPIPYYDSITQAIDFDKISALHLDVEPHTFDDWSENKSMYLDQYVELLDSTLIFCENKNINLSVSIPLHFPKEYIEKIYQRCNLVYFMAYENIKTDYIVRKVKDYDPSKTAIALRTEDFKNLLEIENKIIDIQTQYTPSQFIIHDLRRVIEFEKQ
ncbi:MAG: hypothetical protein COA32_07145 [Fluviicola sp.]|nr:MAG: hypothetical protein COA32_07145 [Fluviicola sp.]